MHVKAKLELIIEMPALRRAEKVLREADVSGWTVLPAVAGFGGNQRWSQHTDIYSATDMVMLVAISDPQKIDAAVKTLGALLARHIGVLAVSEVRVLRPDRF